MKLYRYSISGFMVSKPSERMEKIQQKICELRNFICERTYNTQQFVSIDIRRYFQQKNFCHDYGRHRPRYETNSANNAATERTQREQYMDRAHGHTHYPLYYRAGMVTMLVDLYSLLTIHAKPIAYYRFKYLK